MRAAETGSVGAITTALLRRDTYLGHAREAANLVRAVASYPGGVLDRAVTFGRPAHDGRHDTPVLLIHGFGHNRSAWMVLDRHLRQAGFTSVHSFNDNPFVHDVPQMAARLKERIALIRALTGAPQVHLVGHSLGGTVIRWFVQELDGAAVVDTAICVATPHQGTRAAFTGALFGRTARQLLPGSAVMRRLNSRPLPASVRWVSYYSNLDLLIQPCSSAKLDGAANLLAKDHGHVSVLLSPKVARSIVDQLEASEGVPGVATVRGIGSAPAATGDAAAAAAAASGDLQADDVVALA
jgi:triacylglycerol esterase/lipase EstA (alpha/beta hydrolase family)